MNQSSVAEFRPKRVKINDWYFMVSKSYNHADHKMNLSSVAGHPSRERTFWCVDCKNSISALACKNN